MTQRMNSNIHEIIETIGKMCLNNFIKKKTVKMVALLHYILTRTITSIQLGTFVAAVKPHIFDHLPQSIAAININSLGSILTHQFRSDRNHS